MVIILGGRTLKVTSGGIDNGADPIFDRYDRDVEKFLVGAEGWNAGRRKEVNDTEVDRVALAPILCAQRRRTGPNMIVAG
jgi:hypothetical protein